jgi:hypothetical protein
MVSQSRSWIPGGNTTLRVGHVVHYTTHSEHESGNWTFPAGMNCLATRSPKGDLLLLFLLPLSERRDDKEFARAVWLPDGYGLCGVEPGVLDPMKMSHLMVQKACDEATARVARELKEEADGERQIREKIERDVMEAAARSVKDDLDRQATEEIIASRGADGAWKTNTVTAGATSPLPSKPKTRATKVAMATIRKAVQQTSSPRRTRKKRGKASSPASASPKSTRRPSI